MIPVLKNMRSGSEIIHSNQSFSMIHLRISDSPLPASPVKSGVSNSLDNLSNLVTVPNNILQGDFKMASVNTGRFLINSTVGIFGLIDVAQYLGLPEYDAHVLTLTKEMSDFFEGAIEHGADVKLTSNWLMGGVNEYLNKNQVELQDTQF